jgi:hypothetical protein
MGQKSLKQITYHEAGHAVMALWLRCRFRHVSIIPDENEGSEGHILQGKTADFDPEIRDPSSEIRFHLERLAMVSLAGNAAECILTGRKCKTGSNSDFSHARDHLHYLAPSEDEITPYFNWLRERTRIALLSRWNWFAVETLAKELLQKKYIGRNRVHQIVRKAWKDSAPSIAD